MAREARPNLSAVYLLLVVVVLVVGVVVGLNVAANRRGASYQPHDVEAPARPDAPPGPEVAVAPPVAGTPPSATSAAPSAPLVPVPEEPPAPSIRPIVFGHVVTMEGKPLASASVVLWARQGELPVAPAPLASTKADSRGRYELQAPNTGEYQLLARAYGFVPQAHDSVILQSTDAVVQADFALAPGGSIFGQVFGPSGDTLEGVPVTAFETLPMNLRKRRYRLRDIPRTYDPRVTVPVVGEGSLRLDVEMEDSPFRATSGPNGSYEISGLPEGVYALRAESPRFAPGLVLNVRVGQRGVDFTLAEGASVTGVARGENGAPISGARLHALFKHWVPLGRMNNEPMLRLGYADTFEAETGANGRYLLDRLPAGEYELTLKAEGYLGAYQPLDLLENEQREVDFDLSIESFITGRMADTEGRPVGGCQITAVSMNPGGEDMLAGIGEGESAQSEDNGTYVVRDLPPGTYWVTAGHAGYQSQGRRQVTVGAGETVSDVDFVLTPRSSISGVVVDKAGRPLPGAVVRLGAKEMEVTIARALELMADAGEMEEHETHADAEGRFTLGNLKTRTYDIVVEAEGHAPAELQLPAGTEDARIVLEKAADGAKDGASQGG